MPYNNTYPLKVWATCILGGPLIFSLYIFISKWSASVNLFSEALKGFTAFLFFGFVESIPVIGISYLIYFSLIKTKLKPAIIKLIMFVVGMVLFLGTLSLYGQVDISYERGSFPFETVYTLIFIFATIFFKVKNKLTRPKPPIPE